MPSQPYLCGQLFFSGSFGTLSDLFQEHAIPHQIRHSSHYTDGTYLRLFADSDAELVFEKTGAGEFLIQGEATNQGDLEKLARITSAALASHKLTHRLELYSPNDEEFGYYHYNLAR